LLLSADTAQAKEKIEDSAAAHWCIKVYSPYSINYTLWPPTDLDAFFNFTFLALQWNTIFKTKQVDPLKLR
jgi:hypothetical protein